MKTSIVTIFPEKVTLFTRYRCFIKKPGTQW
jgi:hypothetical protein